MDPDPGSVALPRIEIELHRGIDVRQWEERAGDSALPDSTPYGLGGLAGHGYAVRFLPPPGGGGSRKIVAGAARRFGGGIDWVDGGRRATGDSGVRLCWDERNGLPAALKNSPTDLAVVTGVIWLTDRDQRLNPSVVRLARTALGRASAVWGLSSAQIPVLADKWGVSKDRLHHLEFGIDADFWSRRSTDPAATVDRVISAGNDRHRDHETLIRAMRSLSEMKVSSSLTLVSSQAIDPGELGTRLPSLKHLELRSEYARSAVCAVALKPNIHVSGMTAVLEAQAMGIPVVCTRTEGMSDYVVEGESALLVAPGDVDGFASALRQLLTDPDRRSEMGEAGVKFVRKYRTSRLMTARLAAMIGEAT